MTSPPPPRSRFALSPAAGAARWPDADAANAWAISHGRPPVLIAAVERVETRASGHVDYATKFALFVAELVYGVAP